MLPECATLLALRACASPWKVICTTNMITNRRRCMGLLLHLALPHHRCQSWGSRHSQDSQGQVRQLGECAAYANRTGA